MSMLLNSSSVVRSYRRLETGGPCCIADACGLQHLRQGSLRARHWVTHTFVEHFCASFPPRAFRRSLDLSDNKLQGVYPTELLMLMPMLSYNCASPDCTGMVDLSGNQLYCPQNSSIQGEQICFTPWVRIPTEAGSCAVGFVCNIGMFKE